MIAQREEKETCRLSLLTVIDLLIYSLFDRRYRPSADLFSLFSVDGVTCFSSDSRSRSGTRTVARSLVLRRQQNRFFLRMSPGLRMVFVNSRNVSAPKDGDMT